jgi:hypothetical protein
MPSPDLPFSGTYWVKPGRLLAGKYPGSPYNDEETRVNMRALFDMGIRVFLDLTSPGERVPYQPFLKEQAGWCGIQVSYDQHPFNNQGLPTIKQMTAIQSRIREAEQAGLGVYVHCWSGTGRTGVTVGCTLVENGLDGQAALEKIRDLRQVATNHGQPSPETDAQCAFVREWQPTLR